MVHRTPFALSLVLVSIHLIAIGMVAAQEPASEDSRSAAALLPQSIAVYAEATDLGVAIKRLLDHPLRARLESLPVYDAIRNAADPSKLQMAIDGFEASMGRPWQDAIAVIADRGATFALDRNDGAMALLVRSSDPELLQRAVGFLLALQQVKDQQFGAVPQADYRGFTAYALNDQIKLARLNDWLLVTNHSELGKSIIDSYVDRTPSGLETSPQYQAAMMDRASSDEHSPVVAGYLDVTAFRGANIPKDLYNEKIDNPAAELLLGGVIANLRHTEYAQVQLQLDDSELQLRVAMPHDRDWEPPREYYFGELEHVPAPNLLEVENRLFAASAHRDLSQMWLRASDLLTENASDGLAKADTQLSTFFSGRDFGEDILGSLESDVQFVAKRQDFSSVMPRPAIQLPAFAIQMEMIDPQQTTSEFRRVFQSFVGFLNVVGAMNGQPQLDLGMESIGDAQLVTATYIADADQKESTAAAINFNFTPTLAFAGHRMILSSTTSLARELVGVTTPRPLDTSTTNTHAILEAGALQQVLLDNRKQLVANNMLEKGHDKQSAEQEIDTLMQLIDIVDRATVSLTVTDQQLEFTAGLRLDAE